MPEDQIEQYRQQVAAAMREKSVNEVARTLGVTRDAALSFVVGAEREGTRELILRKLVAAKK